MSFLNRFLVLICWNFLRRTIFTCKIVHQTKHQNLSLVVSSFVKSLKVSYQIHCYLSVSFSRQGVNHNEYFLQSYKSKKQKSGNHFPSIGIRISHIHSLIIFTAFTNISPFLHTVNGPLTHNLQLYFCSLKWHMVMI